MKYLKKYNSFLITENLKMEDVSAEDRLAGLYDTLDKMVKLEDIKLELKLHIEDEWSGTIFEDFDKAYDLCIELDKLFDEIVNEKGKSAKQIICTKRRQKIFNVLLDTADHQATIIHEKYPAGMSELDPEIARASDLVYTIQNFLDSLKPLLPDTDFNKEADKFVNDFLSKHPSSSSSYEENKKQLKEFILKMRSQNFKQEYLTTKWDQKLVNKDPNYPKTQVMYSIFDKWDEYCQGYNPPKDFKDNKSTNYASNAPSTNPAEFSSGNSPGTRAQSY